MVHQRQTLRMVALGLCLLCMGHMAFAATYDAANVVEDVSKCPVKNVPWDPSVFDPSSLGDMAALLEKSVTPDCYTLAATELVTCATDNSLMYSSGCCSKACAAGLQKTVTSGCFKQFIKGICGLAGGEKKYGVALFNAAKRCTGFDASCAADLDALAKAATAAAGKSPAPKAAASPAPIEKPAGRIGDMLPASSPSPAPAAAASSSPAPATPAATPSPAPPTSSAEALKVVSPVLLAAVVALAL